MNRTVQYSNFRLEPLEWWARSMARLMFDSDDLDILTSVRCDDALIATYADLINEEFIAKMGNRLVVIDRGRGDPHNLATIADCEAGALSVEESVDRVKEWQHDGRHGVAIYHDRDLTSQVMDAGKGLDFYQWLTTLDGTVIYDNTYYTAVQFAGAEVLGFHADISIVWDNGWHSNALG